MKFHIRTYGCQMNIRDSEALGVLLERNGFEPEDREDAADVVIVNTCSVRDKAETKAIGKLRLLVGSKSDRPGRVVGTVGCMVQRLKTDIFQEVPGLDFALGTRCQARLPHVLDLVLSGEGPVLDVDEQVDDDRKLGGHAAGSASTFVNILLGCNRRCTYCVVPFVRGPERSRPAAEVLAEVRAVAAAGGLEVTLLGQSVMSYGRGGGAWTNGDRSDLGLTQPFPRLLESVSRIDGIRRVRFTSGHPSGCTAELARVMAECDAVCEHLHLPLQSGSDRILERMRRGYSREAYCEAVRRVRDQVPGLSLTTDIIVGFPGESPEDFEATRVLMEEIRFDNAFIFKYSPRPGTRAAEWDNDVPPREKLRRNKVLLADLDRHSLAIHERLIGTVMEVRVEGPSLRNAERWSGRTRTNKIVVFEPGPGIAPGDFVDIAIERVTSQTLIGRLKEEG